jgi:hypothetical protein
MLATGASPLFIYYNHTILKDVELASTFIAGFGLIFWYRIQGYRPPLAAVIVARHKAAFAFAPLFLYALADPARISAAQLIVLTCLLSVAAIPVLTSGCVEKDPTAAGGVRPTTPQDVRWDYVGRNVLFWPMVWIALGACIAVLLRLSSASEELSASRALVVSALGFSLSYAIVGIASEIRYYYWPIMAIQTSLIVAFPSLGARIRTMDRTVIACILLLILTVAAGFFARLTDNHSLMF